MGDSDLSASELRQRYHKGGSLADSELSAKQVRARHAVPSNATDFSTRHAMGGASGMAGMIVAGVAVVLVIGTIFYFSK